MDVAEMCAGIFFARFPGIMAPFIIHVQFYCDD